MYLGNWFFHLSKRLGFLQIDRAAVSCFSIVLNRHPLVRRLLVNCSRPLDEVLQGILLLEAARVGRKECGPQRLSGPFQIGRRELVRDDHVLNAVDLREWI